MTWSFILLGSVVFIFHPRQKQVVQEALSFTTSCVCEVRMEEAPTALNVTCDKGHRVRPPQALERIENLKEVKGCQEGLR